MTCLRRVVRVLQADLSDRKSSRGGLATVLWVVWRGRCARSAPTGGAAGLAAPRRLKLARLGWSYGTSRAVSKRIRWRYLTRNVPFMIDQWPGNEQKKVYSLPAMPLTSMSTLVDSPPPMILVAASTRLSPGGT